MRHLKLFEQLNENDETIDLIGYPEGDIITVTQDEFDKLKEAGFKIQWDDEIDYEEGNFGQWRFNTNKRHKIEDWLEFYRAGGDPKQYKQIRKYNL